MQVEFRSKAHLAAISMSAHAMDGVIRFLWLCTLLALKMATEAACGYSGREYWVSRVTCAAGGPENS